MTTARERFLKVFRGKIPDRGPVTLFVADQGHFINQVYPDVDPWDFEAIQLKVLEIPKPLGVDVFVRQLYGLNDPLSIHTGGLNVSRQTETWEVHTQEQRRGSTVVQTSEIRTPGGAPASSTVWLRPKAALRNIRGKFRKGHAVDWGRGVSVQETQFFSAGTELEARVQPRSLGVSVRPDQQIAAGSNGRQGRIGRGDPPLGGLLRIVRQVQTARIDGHASMVVDLDPIIILTLWIGFRRAIGRHHLVDDE